MYLSDIGMILKSLRKGSYEQYVSLSRVDEWVFLVKSRKLSTSMIHLISLALNSAMATF
jgi:hypothetical protein